MSEFVYIKHPDVTSLGGPVPRENMDFYAAKGWEEATAQEVKDFLGIEDEEVVNEVANEDAAPDVLTAEDLEGIRKRADLDAIALERGIDPSEYDNMTALREAVSETLQE